MPDWSKSMQQTYEYYIVDPETWRDIKPLNSVKTSSINRDKDAETLGSASINITETIDECYIRIYLITIQNGIKEKTALGTFLAQPPSSSFDGKIHDYSVDAYTPLMELKEKHPPFGYALLKDTNIMTMCCRLVAENLRAPVVLTDSDSTLFDNFVALSDDTWLSFTTDLLAQAKYSFITLSILLNWMKWVVFFSRRNRIRPLCSLFGHIRMTIVQYYIQNCPQIVIFTIFPML